MRSSVEQHARHAVLRDAQGQPLHDGRLAHAGVADKHGIVFLAAAQDLRQPFYLLLAPHDGVELVVERGAGDVRAEGIERGRVALLALRRAGRRPALRVAGVRVVLVLILLVGIVVGHARGGRGALQVGFGRLVGHVLGLQHFHGQVVLLLQQGQQQVLGVHGVRCQGARLQFHQLHNALRAAQQGDGIALHGHVGAYAAFDGLFHPLHVHLQVLQYVAGPPLAVAQQGQQQMFGSHVIVAQPLGLLAAVCQHASQLFGIVHIHNSTPFLRYKDK